MAGHSKWANIQHRKGRQDKLRSKLFSKLAKDIAIASKIGGPDPDMNPRLRLAIANAKGQSMPKDNIQRAVDKGAGGEGDEYEDIRYEGFGPGGIGFIVEASTDNKNRAAMAVRTAFSKNGGALINGTNMNPFILSGPLGMTLDLWPQNSKRNLGKRNQSIWFGKHKTILITQSKRQQLCA